MGGEETDALMNGVNKRGRLNVKTGENAIRRVCLGVMLHNLKLNAGNL
jgi:hypothetical protein